MKGGTTSTSEDSKMGNDDDESSSLAFVRDRRMIMDTVGFSFKLKRGITAKTRD
jgi:hypothetical protein